MIFSQYFTAILLFNANYLFSRLLKFYCFFYKPSSDYDEHVTCLEKDLKVELVPWLTCLQKSNRVPVELVQWSVLQVIGAISSYTIPGNEAHDCVILYCTSIFTQLMPGKNFADLTQTYPITFEFDTRNSVPRQYFRSTQGFTI